MATFLSNNLSFESAIEEEEMPEEYGEENMEQDGDNGHNNNNNNDDEDANPADEDEDDDNHGNRQSRRSRHSLMSCMSADSSSSDVPMSSPRHHHHHHGDHKKSDGAAAAASSNDCVKVAVRIRPLLPLEKQESCLTILDEPPPLLPDEDEADQPCATSLRVGSRRTGMTYTFDCVYPGYTSQGRLYQHSVVPLLNACLEGYNATILAYGQTGSGKTHTILGNHVTGDTQGILPRTIHALFDALSHSPSLLTEEDAEEHLQSTKNTNSSSNDRPCDDWKVQVQFLEIYGDDIRDLLRPGGSDSEQGHHHHHHHHGHNTTGSTTTTGHPKVTIRDGVALEEPEVLGVVQPQVFTAAEALQILQTGRLRRVTAATAMNATSSRSHALFTILVEQMWKNNNGNGNNSISRRSKFHFVDLAGSERAKRTQAVGQRLKEGIEINKGLLVLGNVIAALASSKVGQPTFVPYRDSKLTRLLRGSLGGNHKTLMIACVSPSADNLEESLNCLRYANRAKQIQNKATINLDPTSQYILTLQQHISKLAQQALFHYTIASASGDQETRNSATTAKEGNVYTKDQLQALAAGESMERVLTGIAAGPTTIASDEPLSPTMTSPTATSLKSRHWGNSATGASPTTLLAPIPMPKDEAEESLYWQKAQSSMHQVFRSGGGGGNVGVDTPRGPVTPPGGVASGGDSLAVQDMMMQKMVEYEREIGELKKALAVERSQRAMIQEEQSWMDEVQQSLKEDRDRLERLQHMAEGDDEDDEESGVQCIEAEQEAEQAALKSWTQKYGSTDGDDYENENEDREPDHHIHQEQREEDNEGLAQSLTGSPPSKHREIQQDLMELARSIAAKEELIGELRASQERYEMMREFYEAKLKEMEQHLAEMEEERETLLKKLDDAHTAKAGGLKSQELREKLRQKEEHILTLKKKSAELRNLTAVSSRNATQISRLTRDVEEMKRRKVDLQKQLTVERKNHAETIKRLQKEAVQKDRELTKYKRLTTQKEIEAEKANQIARTRLVELGALRQKYRDTEQKLRLQSVKRGVMAKAGIDPVLVGQRDKAKHNVDTNALRDLFDEKVSKVARKEALVNKLAEEWEQHFQLSSQRDEVAKHAENPEDLENIELQLKYKEDRIRNLAKRLEKEASPEDPRDKRSDNKESFLFDAQFERVCKSAPPDVAHKSLAKVLFGMVVRERRRVAALARTACSLDERLQTATEELEAKELALRSYVEEQRAQVAEMSQNQQNQILSLMELVKEDHQNPRRVSEGRQSSAGTEQNDDFDETLLVLANERISLLEQQLETMTSDAEAAASYRADMDEAKEALRQSEEEKRHLEEELEKVNSEMRKLKSMLAKTPGRGVEVSRVMAVVDRALGQEPSGVPTRKPGVSKLPSAIIDLDESEAEDENMSGGEPEWANEIMEDLALIAEGKVPPSLKSAPDYEEKGKVFDRLAAPENFTGTQKQLAQLHYKSKQKVRNPTPSYAKEVDDSRGTEPPTPTGRQRALSSRSGSRSSSRQSTSSHRDRSLSASSVGKMSNPEHRVPRISQTNRRNDSSVEQRHQHHNHNQEHQENVFDRLSHQSTFSFSVRQNGVPEEEEYQQQTPRMTSVDALLDEVLGVTRYNGHSSPDVFERLTKTTTEAYAMKRK